MLKDRVDLMELFDFENAFAEDISDAIDHGRLVSNLAYRLSKELGYDEDFCTMMGDAGLVHDIGKLQLGEFLYGRRNNALKIEEIKYIRMHATLSSEYLTEKGIVSDEVSHIIKHHHENYDGSGYPDNIKGDSIPEGSRIIRICDVYSALVSVRPYRPAFDRDTAIVLMIDEVKNFDMKMFLAFMRVIHADDFVELLDYIDACNEKRTADLK